MYQLDRVTLHTRTVGHGPVALFVHGFPFDSRMWLDQIEALADVRTCVAVDLRGFGVSSPVGGETLTMELFASDLDLLLDAMGADRVDLVGLSMGGYVALAFAEMFGHRLRSLALVDSRAGADDAEGRRRRDLMARAVMKNGRRAMAAEIASAVLADSVSAPVRARLQTMIEATPFETFLGAVEGMKQRPDRSQVLAAIICPTSIVVGEHDAITPPHDAEAMAAAIADAELHVIPDAAHVSPMEQPEAVNAALRALFTRTG